MLGGDQATAQSTCKASPLSSEDGRLDFIVKSPHEKTQRRYAWMSKNPKVVYPHIQKPTK